MLLGIGERLLLFSALPKEGSFEDLRLMRELRERLTLTEDERSESQFSQEGDYSRWLKPLEREYTFTDGERATLVKGLQTLDRAGKAQEGHLEMFELLSNGGDPQE